MTLIAPRKHRPVGRFADSVSVVAGAVARVDNLEFLTDVVPKTISYKEFKAKKAKNDSKNVNGQTTLTNGQNGAAHAGAPPTAPAAAAAVGPETNEVLHPETMDIDDDKDDDETTSAS